MTFPEETSAKTEALTAESPEAGAPESSTPESPEGTSAEAVPEVPQAPIVATRLKSSAAPKETWIPIVWATARDSTVIVTAAPLILMVAPSGMLTE